MEGWLNKSLREPLSETAEEAYAKIEDNDDTEMYNCKLSDSKLMISRAEKKTPERGEWSNPCDFFISCLGYAVGLGTFLFQIF